MRILPATASHTGFGKNLDLQAISRQRETNQPVELKGVSYTVGPLTQLGVATIYETTLTPTDSGEPQTLRLAAHHGQPAQGPQVEVYQAGTTLSVSA
ncbi:MAG: hypothetical protein KC475_10710 [Cyanobacteria bacterium HKST-UBA03]|nr:hypothetical protein [Cyanobacteria bacterium HKST-UBA03]